MKCKSIEKMLSEYASDELNVIERGIVRHHVKYCESCCAELSACTKIREQAQAALQTQYQDLPGESIWPQIVSRGEMIHKPQKAKETRIVPTLWRRTFPVLAGSFVLLLSLWIHHARQSPPKELLKSALPLVEDFQGPGLTMMTFETDDPTISIVWFFKDDPSMQDNKNGGV